MTSKYNKTPSEIIQLIDEQERLNEKLRAVMELVCSMCVHSNPTLKQALEEGDGMCIDCCDGAFGTGFILRRDNE